MPTRYTPKVSGNDVPSGMEDFRNTTIRERYAIGEMLHAHPGSALFGGADMRSKTDIILRAQQPSLPHDDAAMQRFEQRLETAHRMLHRAHEPPIDWWKQPDGTLCAVYCRPPGVQLHQLLQRQTGGFKWDLVQPLLVDLIDLLMVAHGEGLIHGTLSPSSCWVLPAHVQGARLRVIDLGATSLLELGPDQAAPAGTTVLAVDAAFMAPEVPPEALGDVRSDIYRVGLIAYTALVGEPPFQSNNPFRLVTMHMREPVPSMAKRGAQVPESVETWIHSLLAKDPSERPASMSDVAQTLPPPGGGSSLNLGAATTFVVPTAEIQAARASASASHKTMHASASAFHKTMHASASASHNTMHASASAPPQAEPTMHLPPPYTVPSTSPATHAVDPALRPAPLVDPSSSAFAVAAAPSPPSRSGWWLWVGVTVFAMVAGVLAALALGR